MKRLNEHGFSNYAVSKVGEVYSIKNKKRLSKRPDKAGYLFVKVVDDTGRSRSMFVHRLVGFAYLDGMTKSKNQINHKNGIKDDNRVENLEWCTAKQNWRHAQKNRLSVRGVYPSISKSEQRRLSYLYSECGYTVNALCDEFDISVGFVRRLLVWRGVYENNRVYYKVDWARVKILAKTGLFTAKELGLMFNLTSTMINFKIRKDPNMKSIREYRNMAINRLVEKREDVRDVAMCFNLEENTILNILDRKFECVPSYGVEDFDKFKRLVKEGKSRAELKQVFDCGDGALDTALRITGTRIKQKKYDYDKIKSMRINDRMSYGQISSSLGMRYETVQKICSSMGVGGKIGKSGNPTGKNSK